MVNLESLKEIEYETCTDIDFVKFKNGQLDFNGDYHNIIPMTDDMIDVFDYVQQKSGDMARDYPSFSNGVITFFSYDGNIYSSFYFQQQGKLTIKKGEFLTQETIDEEGFTFEEWSDDMMVYYYLDLDTMTVRSLWDNKTYSVRKDMGQ